MEFRRFQTQVIFAILCEIFREYWAQPDSWVASRFCMDSIHMAGIHCSAEFFQKVNLVPSHGGGGIVSSLAVLDQECTSDVDAVEEMRMRSWARRHYTPAEDRSNNMHPIVLDEMLHKDQERTSLNSSKCVGSGQRD